jgi:hypothetical protein
VDFYRSRAADPKQWEKGEIPPFRCKVSEAISDADYAKRKFKSGAGSKSQSQISFQSPCPLTMLFFDRALLLDALDVGAGRQMSLGSLKSSLGSRWNIVPVCEENDRSRDAKVNQSPIKPPKAADVDRPGDRSGHSNRSQDAK